METDAPERRAARRMEPPSHRPAVALLAGISTSGLRRRGGNRAVFTGRLDFLLDAETLAEAHLLDFEVAAGQRQLLAKRNTFAAGQPQAAAKEAGEAHAHFPGARAVDGAQSGDGVQAVEQKVRVDLRAESLQLGFAGQRAGFGGVALGGAGGLHRECGVMQSGGEQVEQHAHAE